MADACCSSFVGASVRLAVGDRGGRRQVGQHHPVGHGWYRCSLSSLTLSLSRVRAAHLGLGSCSRSLDHTGQEDYKQLRTTTYQNTDIFLLCFSVVHPSSFDNVKWVRTCACLPACLWLLVVWCFLVRERDDPRRDERIF